MGYQLEIHESAAEGIRRIVWEEIDYAIANLQHPTDRDKAIHETRKCFKKIRAVIRLVRDELGKRIYKAENYFYRDLGRTLSPMRDSAVLIESLEKLKKHFGERFPADFFNHAKDQLTAMHHERTQQELEGTHLFEKVIVELEKGRARITEWPIRHKGFSPFCGGLHRIYQRGKKRMRDADKETTDETLHEWRKRVKDMWYAVCLFQPSWNEILKPYAEKLHDLSDLLGDDHDLGRLKVFLSEHPDVCMNDDAKELLVALIKQDRTIIQSSIWPLGGRIFTEKPEAFLIRIRGYWEIWKKSNPKH